MGGTNARKKFLSLTSVAIPMTNRKFLGIFFFWKEHVRFYAEQVHDRFGNSIFPDLMNISILVWLLLSLAALKVAVDDVVHWASKRVVVSLKVGS